MFDYEKYNFGSYSSFLLLSLSLQLSLSFLTHPHRSLLTLTLSRSHALNDSDQGGEFSIVASTAFQEKWELEVYKSRLTKVKNAITESANKILQNRLYKFMTSNNNFHWCDHLGDIVSGINTLKRDLLFGYSADEVKNNTDIQSIVRKKFMLQLYNYQEKFKKKKPIFHVGQTVKKVAYAGIFNRGYTKNTEPEVYRISKVLDTAPYTYLLNDNSRPYYGQELVSYDDKDKKQKIYDYYISEHKPILRRVLRSGQFSKNSEENIYHLKSLSSPQSDQWIDKSEVDILIKNGLLSPSVFEK